MSFPENLLPYRGGKASERTLALAVQDGVRSSRSRPLWQKVLIGALAAATAVLVRWLLPLSPQQLPTIAVVVATALKL